MPAARPPTESELVPLLAPLMGLSGPEAETSMGQTVGQGLALPPAPQVVRRALAPEQVGTLLDETLEWLRTVLNEEWLPENLDQQLFALPKALDDEDAFIGAWQRHGRIIQVAVTCERVHMITRMVDAPVMGADMAKMEAALRYANQALLLPEELDIAKFDVRPFGGLVLANRPAPSARNWHETLLVLTDGQYVKYSVIKYKDRTSREERESAIRTALPWFPREQ